MRLPRRARALNILMVAGLLAALLGPASPVAAADPVVLRAGTDQDLQVLNPWHSVVVADYEAYTLNYDLLVGFGQDLQPAPGFAEEWSSSDDGMTHTFKIRPDMKWSDGEPATSEDARWTYQLVLDAVADEVTLGSGYLEPYLTNAGIKTVTAPDPLTLVVETEFPTTLLTQAYVPILPKHIWSKYTLEQIASSEADDFFKNDPPVVGTGPYQAVEFKPGEFIRFARNPNYWGPQGAADEIILQKFASTDTMVQALRRGEVDYVRGVQPDQFDALKTEPNVQVVEGFANGYSELAFNTYGKDIEGGGASTKALRDPAFRDALGYAIDQARLVDATLAGHGVPGDTIVPPYHTNWHVAPTTPRRFDLDEAKRRLDAAGYALDGSGKRLDKEGEPITLRLTWPDSEAEHATDAQFIQGWFQELGIAVDAAVTEEGKLIDDILPPEAEGKANFDMFMWGWVGDPDPMSLLSFFTTDQIGSLNDSFFTNERYDELFALQQRAVDENERKGHIAEMQNIVYDQAPYHVLYYDSELHAYRTDRFGGWTNQPPEGGTPLFGYGPIGYTKLTVAGAESPSPSAGPSDGSAAPGSAAPGASSAASPAASGTTSPTGTAASNTTPILIGAVVLIALVAVGLVLARRRGAVADDE
jgi:peptide/nickel transport system substrate-binding protein